MSGQITALYAALIGLLLIYLSMRVITHRQNKKVGIGDNGDTEIQRAIRVQANLVEYAPIALLLLFFAEHSGLDARIIHAFGVTLVVARIGHAFGLNKSAGVTKGRFFGTLATFLIIAALSIINIVRFFI